MVTRIFILIVNRFVMTFFLLGMLGACASQGQQGQDQGEDNLNSNSQENQGENFKANGEGEGDGGAAQGSTQPNEGGGADVNSATEDDPNLNATLNNGATNPAPEGNLPPPSNSTEAGMGEAPASPPPVNNSASAPPAASAPTAPAAPPPAASGGDQAPIPGGRVRYVKEGGVQVVNAPGGSPVFTLEQGDHPVTWEENGWLKLSTGMYVPKGALSEQGVGRVATGNAWR